MGVELKSLKEKYNAEFVFLSEGENIESVGDISIDKKEIKQMVVVLMQSIDAAEISKTKIIEIYSADKKLVFLLLPDSVIGMLVNADTDNIVIEEKTDIKAKTTVKIKEKPKKVIVKQKESKEEIRKESVAVSKNYVLNDKTITKILNIAHEYLEEFAEDIMENLIKETKTDKNNPTNENIENLIKKLKKSASLIIGPSHADEMIKKINTEITE